MALLLAPVPVVAQEEPAQELTAESEAEPEETKEGQKSQESKPKDDDSGERASRRFGGPDQVDNQMAEDETSTSRMIQKRLFGPYFEWKKRLKEKSGLSFSVDYSSAYLAASGSPDEDQAASGIGRFYCSWDLVGRESGNAGAFVWKIEHRHKYTDIPPSAFGFNLGYIGLIEPPFSGQEFRWTNLYWRQRWKDGRIAMFAGFLDATDYLDVYAMASPWTGFLNFAFSTGTLTIPVPNDATLGVAAGSMLSRSLFLIGGLVDRNADPTDPFDGFGTFFEDNEYFKSIELGWTPSHDRLYLDNMHLTLWQADERVEARESSGWWANFSFTRFVANKYLPFVRAGYAKNGGSLMQKSVSVGFGYQPVAGGDVLGFGFNWGEPNEDTFGRGRRDQYTTEVYYRLQLSPQLAITPDFQLLVNPALDIKKERVWVFGIRARLAL